MPTIAENLQRLQTARTDIANAITTMGGTVAQGAGLEDFPSAILGIPSGATIIPLSRSGGDTNTKVYAVYYDGMLSVFGSDSKNFPFGSVVEYTFPSSLADLGVQNNLSGIAITKSSAGTYTDDISLTPSSTSVSVHVAKSGSGIYDFTISGAFTPTT